MDQVGYFIEPQDLFSAMIREIETQDFDIEHLATAIRKVETSTLGEESENDFIGLFSDMDLSSTRLGNNVKELKAELIDQVGYFIEPQDLFSAMIREIETQDFDIEHLATAIRKVETSTLGEESENDFIGLFSDMDLSSTRLGNNVKE
ncbi:hypothetical protein AAGY76_13545, partial [Staphylococcus aureus]